MRREDDEPLWDLLGRSPKQEVSPFFARNVVRRIREENNQQGWGRWFSFGRLVPATGLAVAVICAALYLRTPADEPELTEFARLTEIDAQDYEVVFDLEDLYVADDESGDWVENSIL